MKLSTKTYKLYGVEHSPWVLGVWYSLQHENIKPSLSSLPIGIRWHLKNGITFPVLVENNKRQIKDSFKIYQYLQKNGHRLCLPKSSDQFQKELERFFLSYSPARTAKGKDILFLRGWMTMEDHPESLKGSFSRGFLFLYYYLLIKLALLNNLFRSKKFHSQENIKKHLKSFDKKLQESHWIGGEKISFLDFALFGHFECICSGPTDEIMNSLKTYPNIISWLKKMIVVNSGKEPIFVKRLFQQDHQILRNNKFNLVFIFSVVFWLLIFPITFVSILFFLINRTWGNNYSGARL